MDRAPPVVSLAAARALALPTGRRSAEAFRDDDVEIRFAAPPGVGPQVPHDRDEFYIVVGGTGLYRIGDVVTAIGPGDLVFAAAHEPHGFEDISPDFMVWIVFYGQPR